MSWWKKSVAFSFKWCSESWDTTACCFQDASLVVNQKDYHVGSGCNLVAWLSSNLWWRSRLTRECIMLLCADQNWWGCPGWFWDRPSSSPPCWWRGSISTWEFVLHTFPLKLVKQSAQSKLLAVKVTDYEINIGDLRHCGHSRVLWCASPF